MNDTSIEYILLAMQSALLGEVSPALRAVLVNFYSDEDLFQVRFYYEGEVSEERIDLWDCVIAEASASIGARHFIDKSINKLDYPKPILFKGYCAYWKKEDAALPNEILLQINIREPTLAYALLAVQQTLLGAVTPELRAVVVDVEQDPLQLYIRFYYNGEIPAVLYQYWQSIQSKALRYFEFDCLLNAGIERIDYPHQIPFRGRYAFLRHELKI